MRKHLALSLVLVLLFLSGCGETGSSETPLYNTPGSPTPATATPAPTPSAEESPSDTPAEIPMPDPVYFTDFAGVEIAEETPQAAGSPFANLYSYGKPAAFCADGESLYYVNFGEDKDNYLYSYQDGKSECLIEMQVNYPVLKDGTVYFISNESFIRLYGTDFYPGGKLYQYNLADKTVELLLDRDVWDLRIVGEYLYFRNAIVFNGVGEKASGNEAFKLSLHGGMPEAIGDALPYFYGEYQLHFTPQVEGEYRALMLVSAEETVPLTGKGFTGHSGLNFCIDGDILWFKAVIDGRESVVSIDLQSGERRIYPAGGGIESFAVVDGGLFITSKAEWYRYDRETEQFVKMQATAGKTYKAVCTDGRYLYAVAAIGELNVNQTTVLSRFIPLGSDYREVDLNP